MVSVEIVPFADTRRNRSVSKSATTNDPSGSMATLTGFENNPTPKTPSTVPGVGPPATVVTVTLGTN